MFTVLVIIAIICTIYAYKKSVNPDIDESGLRFKDSKKIEEYKNLYYANLHSPFPLFRPHHLHCR